MRFAPRPGGIGPHHSARIHGTQDIMRADWCTEADRTTHQDQLRGILCAYVYEHRAPGYVQGMTGALCWTWCGEEEGGLGQEEDRRRKRSGEGGGNGLGRKKKHRAGGEERERVCVRTVYVCMYVCVCLCWQSDSWGCTPCSTGERTRPSSWRLVCSVTADILEPILIAVEDEAVAHLCFTRLMVRTMTKFDRVSEHGVQASRPV